MFPEFVARMIYHGTPFELMDGEARNIPRIWIRKVFESLQKILGDQKCNTVSVLGIQSSGKSTLLNSMFGLNFSVSAGRCTRGVFMKLLQVNET